MIKNPLSVWFMKYVSAKFIERKNKNVKIGYMSYVKGCSFEDNIKIYNYTSVTNSTLGRHTYIGNENNITNTDIGRFCCIGPGCRIGLGIHPTHLVSIHPAFYSEKPRGMVSFSDMTYLEESKKIEIGNDVWIGANVTIIDGVQIGNGAVIASGAVVTKPVPPYAIVGGVPAKVIKKRFDDETISKLLEEKWWDLTDDYFKSNFKKFHDVDLFLSRNHGDLNKEKPSE